MQQKGFKLIGIETKTSNKNGQALNDIGGLWGTFISERLLEKIPHTQDSDLICVYTDYESDYTGNYTCMLGVKVDTLEDIPEGLVGRSFEGGTFEIFVAQGEFPQAIQQTWEEIWARDKELNRAYSYDYEVYSESARQGAQSEALIYISKK